MKVIINNIRTETSARTLEELITEQQVPTAGLAVAVGSKVIARADWISFAVSEGMVITLIRATQGG